MPPLTRSCLRAAGVVACLPMSFPAFAAWEPPPLLAQASDTAPPGQVIVDEEAAKRALERALVSTGLVLLPAGQAELEPAFTYVRAERNAPVLLDGTDVGRQVLNTDILEASLLLRLGLPDDLQLELDVPYQYVEEELVTESQVGAAAVTASEDGVGDVRVGVAKALLSERTSRPDLVARLTWDTSTGDTGGTNVGLVGTGFNELEFSLSATKRQDPLVFIGEVFFQKTLDEQDQIEPGDLFGLSLGVLLAASPDTSLRVTLDQVRVQEVRVDGVDVSGSDAVIGSLTVGASSVVGDGKFFDFSVQAGLTEDAPAYGFRASYSTRFHAWRR